MRSSDWSSDVCSSDRFITGDRVQLLADGYIRFADRDKDMLKVGGENVAASEIERVVMTVPGIQECAVVARKDKMLDEVPVAFLLVPGGEAAAPADLKEKVMAACRQGLADFQFGRASWRENGCQYV